MEYSTYSESSSTPWATTTHFLEIGQDGESFTIAQWHETDTMMGQGAHESKSCALLSSSQTGGRDKAAGILADQSSRSPELPSGVPEVLPLGGEVTVSGWDTEDEGIVFLKRVGSDEGDGFVLRRYVHLAENFLGESLLDSKGRTCLVRWLADGQ